MRKYLHLILFLAMGLGLNARGEWSSPISVSQGSCPDLDINKSDGTLHIVSMFQGVTYTVMDSLGNLISQEIVPNAHGDVGDWYYGASIALDASGNPHVLFRTPLGYDNRFDLFYTKKESGRWSTPILISSELRRGYIVRHVVDQMGRVHIAQGYVPEANSVPYGAANYYQVYQNRLITEKTHEGLTPYRVDSSLEIGLTSDGTAHLILGNPDLYHGHIQYYTIEQGGSVITNRGDLHSIQCPNRNGMPDIFVDGQDHLHVIYGARVDNAVEGTLSIRYVRIENGVKVLDRPATRAGAIEAWKGTEKSGWGLGSVASTADGKIVGVAYLQVPEGPLKWVVSNNGGISWSQPSEITDVCGGRSESSDGRNLHVVRAYRNHFYCVYPVGNLIRLRVFRDAGDFPPTAHSGGPYYGQEGSPVTLDMSASTDFGQNAGIVEYAWDWDMDEIYDLITASNTVEVTFMDDFDSNVVLRVTDRSGQTDYDTTRITIANVPPVVDAGPDRSCFEGDTLLYTVEIWDPGDDEHTIEWNFGDGTVAAGDSIYHAYRDEGTGLYYVVVKVTDDDGGVGRDTVRVTVWNAPPVADGGGPYSAPVGEVIQFMGSGWDSGVDDVLSYAWDLDFDGIFETPGRNASRSYDEVGLYYAAFRVQDNDGGVDIDTVKIRISEEAPTIVGLYDQTILEGECFPDLNLDDYVVDLDHTPDRMTWTVTGYVDLVVELNGRILSVCPPDTNWNGVEKLTFTVADPLGLSDTADVLFTVLPVNDRPLWLEEVHYTFNEDDTLQIKFKDLQKRVMDVDDPVTSLRFSITGNRHIHWHSDTVKAVFYLWADPDWYGVEIVSFVVSDPHGAWDAYDCQITVISQPDPPRPFSLISPLYSEYFIWPDSLRFKWHNTTDPDPDDQVYFEWKMWKSVEDHNVTPHTHMTLDTTCQFITPENMEAGTYLWRVWAWDNTGLSRPSSNIGILVIEMNTDVNEETSVPTEYKLLPNFPNPFNPQTAITWHLPLESHVKLTIFNMLGQAIRVLTDERRPAGIHTILWDGMDDQGRSVPSGVYIYRLHAGDKVFFRKMTFLQ